MCIQLFLQIYGNLPGAELRCLSTYIHMKNNYVKSISTDLPQGAFNLKRKFCQSGQTKDFKTGIC